MEFGIGVAVMAGGQSKRMGSPKALLTRPDGRTFMEYVCGQLKDFPKKYLSINAGQDYSYEGYTLVVDKYDNIGPMGGIASVLSECDCEAVLFVAVDMPYITTEVVKDMICEYNGEDAFCARSARGVEPLCCIYSTRVLQLLTELITTGNYRLRELLDAVDTKYFEVSKEIDFKNINTPLELKKYYGCDKK